MDTWDLAERRPVASNASISARGSGPTTPPDRVRTRYVPEARLLGAGPGAGSVSFGAAAAGATAALCSGKTGTGVDQSSAGAPGGAGGIATRSAESPIEAEVARGGAVGGGAGKVARSLEARRRAVGKGPLEHVREILLDAPVADEAELTPRNARQDLEVRLAGKERAPGEHLREDDADGE